MIKSESFANDGEIRRITGFKEIIRRLHLIRLFHTSLLWIVFLEQHALRCCFLTQCNNYSNLISGRSSDFCNNLKPKEEQ